MTETPPAVTALGGLRTEDAVHPDSRQARTRIEKTDLPIDADAFEARMESLIKDCGFPPKRARYRTISEMSSLTHEEIGDVFGVAKGTVDATAPEVRAEAQTCTVGHYALFDQPMNFLARVEFTAEHPADYKERFYFYEFSYADPAPRRPGEDPPRDYYCVIREDVGTHAEFGYAVSNIDIQRYQSREAVIEDLYESEYFWSVERAQEWTDALSVVFPTAGDFSSPDERLNPDAEQ